MSFSEKELIPTTTLFLLGTLFFSILRVGLIDEETEIVITSSPYLIISLITLILYLFLYFLLSLSKKTAKLINVNDKLFKSLLIGLFWLGICFAISYFYGILIADAMIYILFPGAIAWIAINAGVLNETIMDTVGVDESERKFSLFKFIFAIILIGATMYIVYSQGIVAFPILIYWVILGVLFLGFTIFDSKKALSAAGYYVFASIYLVAYFYYFIVSQEITQTTNPTQQDTNLILAWSLVHLIINYLMFFYAVGKVADVLDVEEAKGHDFQRLTLLTCIVSFSFITYEYLLYESNFNNPQGFLIQLRFFGILITSVIVYIVTVNNRKSVLPKLIKLQRK